MFRNHTFICLDFYFTCSNEHFLRTPKLFNGLIASSKVKITKGERIGARSLACRTLGVKGRVGASRWGQGRLTSNSIIHTDLQKPNNKLVNA
jgi:hypothetical protein